MTDINTELERIADETLGNPLEEAQDNLDSKGDPRAPTKGAAPSQKEAKIAGGTPGGETQDMGPAVVSPEAKSDPGDAATKKAKKASPPTTKPSDASSKAMGDGSGEMKVGAREEVQLEGEDPEEDNLKAARKAEKKQAAKGGADAEDDDEEGQDDEDRDDKEEATRSKKRPTAEERVAEIDLSDDVDALTSGEGLSEEFKTKAATIFEAALKSKIRTELERLEEEYAEAYDSAISEAKDELTTKVDGYLTYVVEEWMKKNELAVEHRLKTELAEQFIASLRKLFEEHDIAIPDERFDMLEAAATQADDMEGRLNEEIEKNVELTQRVNELSKNEILLDVASDLADTEVEKFGELAESVEYENAEDYRLKLETIMDSYFPKATINEEVEAAPNYEDVEMSSGKMAAYMNTISRAQKRAS
ncbi:uncharacterized protein METZ01_LOCUS134091 [marine metagenome]|uniref:Uncharacterized protein n=1 Tax=marine metagenome TaxID=408172 RepID=A0A381YXP6_9ZZZZ